MEGFPAVPTFGILDAIDPVLRPGGYAVIELGGLVAVVAAPGGLFLPGGGQDHGESPEHAAIREAAEECGLRIEVTRAIGVADEVVFAKSENRYYRKRGTFFRAQVVGNATAIEADHVLLWLT